MSKKYFSTTRKVTSIEAVQGFGGEKFKVCFECETSTGKPRMCVYWSTGKKPDVRVGDEVLLSGQIKNGVFLVYSLLVNMKKRA